MGGASKHHGLIMKNNANLKDRLVDSQNPNATNYYIKWTYIRIFSDGPHIFVKMKIHHWDWLFVWCLSFIGLCTNMWVDTWMFYFIVGFLTKELLWWLPIGFTKQILLWHPDRQPWVVHGCWQIIKNTIDL